jgi:hypothetical protein
MAIESPRRAADVAIEVSGGRNTEFVALAPRATGIEKPSGEIGVAVEHTDGRSFGDYNRNMIERRRNRVVIPQPY